MKYKFLYGKNTMEKDCFYYITTNNGIIKLNQEQYVFLNNFIEFNSIENVIDSFPEEHKNKVRELIKYYIEKKILVPENHVEKNLLSWLNKITKFTMPRFLKEKVEKLIINCASKINIKFISFLFIIINILGLYFVVDIIHETHFVIEYSPRTLFMFIMGFVVALIHELHIALYIIHEKVEIKRWYIRIWLGFFISIGTNWSTMLTKGRRKIINMFSFAINGTLGFVSIFVIITKLLLSYISTEKLMWLVNFSIGGYIFVVISIYPFLFKNDGFYLLQEITKVRKIRARFFRLLISLFNKRAREEWKTNPLKDKIIIIFWGIGFILTIYLVEYFISHRIRIII